VMTFPVTKKRTRDTCRKFSVVVPESRIIE